MARPPKYASEEERRAARAAQTAACRARKAASAPDRLAPGKPLSSPIIDLSALSPRELAGKTKSRKVQALHEPAPAPVAVSITVTPDPEMEVLRAKNAELEKQLVELRKKLAETEAVSNDRKIDLYDLRKTKPGKMPRQASAKNREAVLASRFISKYSANPDEAKRFRTNAKKAATAARETASILSGADFEDRLAMIGDIELLTIAAGILDAYGDGFERTQQKAEAAKAQRERELIAENKKKVQAYCEQFFGTVPDLVHVRETAQNLLEFLKDGEAWLLERRRGVKHVLLNFGRSSSVDYTIKDALRNHSDDAKKLALVIAAELESSSQKGYLYTSKYYDEAGEPAWYAGVDDFEAWYEERSA